MAQQVIAPIIPNFGPQAEAIAGSQSVTFTATDRKVIEERGGTVDRAKSFKDIFFNRDTTQKVENEESTIRQEQDIKALESRRREHRTMLKHSPLAVPREHVEISNGKPEENVIIPPVIIRKPAETPKLVNLETVQVETKKEDRQLHQDTAKIIKELNFNPAEIFDKFALEQKELHGLIYRIKELHLKRLLSNTREEFEELSQIIKQETLAAGRPEAREWLEEQVDTLTKGAAEYKLKLLKSLESMGLNPHQEQIAKWLQKVIVQLSQSKN
jgi:hypothetical protein